MNLDSIIKNLDPVVSNILNKVLDGNNINQNETIELFNSRGMELNMIAFVANHLCKRKKGEIVTYVINRNINFTNVCIKRCGFCAFSRDFREEEGYFLPIV
ncbi:MAG TPA: 7,8-didemethyl-8-hydroxy-5-deazariboflavin synthase subunit CofH, partial [Nitrososphaeraceae archaeon]|nr:7,8-didemethyl-8-hydroxy-5-deazariboflavin synthase subunit CofH [Nitrososphaeraceae archaeon]